MLSRREVGVRANNAALNARTHTAPVSALIPLSHCGAFVGVHEILERGHIHTDIYLAPADRTELREHSQSRL